MKKDSSLDFAHVVVESARVDRPNVVKTSSPCVATELSASATAMDYLSF